MLQAKAALEKAVPGIWFNPLNVIESQIVKTGRNHDLQRKEWGLEQVT